MPSNQLVQSVTRALLIVEILANVEDGLTLQQICNELDLKPPTVHNLLRTLAARGYVERVSEPARYRLGNQLVNLADQHRTLTTQRFAATAVSQVFAQFNQVRVTYCEDIGGDVVLKLRMSPERPGLLERPWHSVMLAYTSASVLVYQAFWREDQRLQYEAKYPFATYGAHIWGDRETIDTFLSDVGRKGHADPPPKVKGERNKLHRVAVPVFSTENSLLGALGAAFSESDVDDPDGTKTDLIAHLKATAAKFAEM